MAFNLKKFLQGIKLIPVSSTTIDEKGEMEVLDSSGKLNIHNGSSASPVVTESHASQGSSRLKNKDLEDSSTSIVDASDTTKKIQFDAGGTTGTKITITGAQTANRVLTLPDATDTLTANAATQTLTNKTLSGNEASNFVNGGATVTLPIVTGTLSTLAGTETLSNKTLTSPQINTPSIANQTNSTEVTLAEISSPSTPASGFGKIYFKSDGFLYQKNDDGTETKVGAGSGGINYISNPDAESSTTGWATYADSASNIPTDGTGGTATGLTFSRTTSSPLRGTGSFLIQQSNSTSIQGKGVSYDFSIDSADKGTPLQISFDFNASSTFVAADGITAPLNDGTTSTNAGNSDIEVFIYDVTNSRLIVPTPQVIAAKGSNNFKYKGEFQASSDSTSYRLILHCATASANATGYQFKFDNVSIGPTIEIMGTPVTDWTTYTPTFSGWTTSFASASGLYKRIGDSVYCKVKIELTNSASGTLTNISIPSGLSVDTNKILSGENGAVGTLSILDSGTLLYSGALIYASNGVTPRPVTTSSTFGTISSDITATSPFTFVSSDLLIAEFSLPISGWASNVVLSNDTDTRIVAARYSSNAGQSLTTGIDNIIDFEDKSFDTHNSVTTGASWKYVAPISGIYRVSAHISLSSSGSWNAGEGANLRLFKNGVDSNRGDFDAFYSVGSTQSVYLSGSNTIELAAGDYINIICNQTSGSSISLINDANYNHVEIERLSGPATIAAADKKVPIVTQITSNAFTNGTTVQTAGTYYTLSSGRSPLYLKVKMVGAGGGGSGGGLVSAMGSGGNGGSSTFGSALTAGGGGGGLGNATGGSGGSSSISLPAFGTSLSGANGMGGLVFHASSIGTSEPEPGAQGGSSQLGGGGTCNYASNGGAGGYGGGGAGGGLNGGTTSQLFAGGGGGAGGYVEAIIYNPSSTYTFSVGSAGTSGSAGAGHFAGGTGGSGLIIVEEYFQ